MGINTYEVGLSWILSLNRVILWSSNHVDL